MPELDDDVKEMVRLLVDEPDTVEVREIPIRQGGGVLKLQVAPEDLGKVIGKEGRTAQSMRTTWAWNGRLPCELTLNDSVWPAAPLKGVT